MEYSTLGKLESMVYYDTRCIIDLFSVCDNGWKEAGLMILFMMRMQILARTAVDGSFSFRIRNERMMAVPYGI